MGLTRERWCCVGCWLSKLDINTCQASIKTDILIIVSLKPACWVNQTIRDHHNGSLRTDQSGEGQKLTNNDLKNMRRRSTTETIMYPIGQNHLLIYPHFGTANSYTAVGSMRKTCVRNCSRGVKVCSTQHVVVKNRYRIDECICAARVTAQNI